MGSSTRPQADRVTLSGSGHVPQVSPSRLLLGPLCDLDVSVSIVPYMTVLGTALESVEAFRRGLDPRIRDVVARSVAHLGGRPFDLATENDWPATWPDFTMPLIVQETVPLRTVLDTLRDTPADLIANQVESVFAGDVPTQWRPAARHPDRFRSDFLDLLVETGATLNNLWNRLRPSLDRERRRVELAVTSGRLEPLLQSLSPALRYSDQALTLPEQWELGDIELAGRPLVLMPSIGGPSMLASNADNGEGTVWICYSIPLFDLDGLGPEFADEPPLEVLLGRQRAVVMRYLHRPTSMAEIASLLRATPANATFHVNQLAAAGLVAKQRRGKEIRINVTQTGSDLIRLLDHARAQTNPVRIA